MNEKMFEDLEEIIDYWINQLGNYTLEALQRKPSPESFSMGQLYRHLILDTNFYLDEAAQCLSHNDNVHDQPNPMALQMFLDNSFPDARLQGDPSNEFIAQPESMATVITELEAIKQRVNALRARSKTSAFRGKTKHPGFDYFNFDQWIQFAEMHFRHHLRQKKRIDEFLTLA